MDVATVDDKAAAMEDFGKVCALFYLGGELSVFLVGLNQENEEKSVEIKPTFTIKKQDEAIPYLFHVLRGNLYVFTYPRYSEPVVNLQAYAINLSEKINNTRLELTTCEKCPPCLGPKSRPRDVGYDGNILLFSSQIAFCFEDLISEGIDDTLNDDSRVDFEIYDPKGCNSRKLPQLHVCRPKSYYDYYDDDSLRLKLYDYAKSQYREEEFKDDKWGRFFCIISYCVDGDNFVVETDFGRKFCLNLKLDVDGDDYGWRLCEDESYVFESIGLNILTPNGVCYDASGANDYRRRWVLSKQDPETRDEKRQKMDHGSEDVRRVDFPSVIERGKNLATSAVSLLKDNPATPCIVQATFFDGSAFVDYPSKLHWFLDVLNLDLEEELDDGKFAKKMMTTMKFCMPRELTMGYVLGLFHNS